jgi:hypothetical protein
MGSRGWLERDLVGDTSGHERGVALWVGMSAKAAVVSRAGFVLAGLTMIGWMVSGTMQVLLAIPSTFVLLFLLAFLNGGTRRQALSRARSSPVRIPDACVYSDARVRSLIERLGRARHAIKSTIESAPRGAAFDLSTTFGPVQQLERHVLVIASRLEYLARSLASTPIDPVREDPETLNERVAREMRAAQPGVRLAAERRQAHRACLEELNNEVERLVAVAEQLLGTLEELPARMAVLQAHRLRACHEGMTMDVDTDVTALVDTLRAFEEAAS